MQMKVVTKVIMISTVTAMVARDYIAEGIIAGLAPTWNDDIGRITPKDGGGEHESTLKVFTIANTTGAIHLLQQLLSSSGPLAQKQKYSTWQMDQ